MLLSMTGYGAGEVNQDDISVAVEVRTVNNRYLKLNCRLPDGYSQADDELHLSVGFGLVIKEDYQLDFAANFSDVTDTYSFSLVKFF